MNNSATTASNNVSQPDVPQRDEKLIARRESVVKSLRQMEVNPNMTGRLADAPEAELELLELLVAKIKRPPAKVESSITMSLEEYQEHLERLYNEYVGPMTSHSLKAAGVTSENLLQGAEFLAETAALVRAIPPAKRDSMWSTVSAELNKASQHYETLERAITESGISDALGAEDHMVMSQLRREVIPALDLQVLRLAGESDPERALAQLIRAAQVAPRTVLANKTMVQVFGEARDSLSRPVTSKKNRPKPKFWTGLGKILTGMAAAGANIAGGLALTGLGGPLAAGVTAGGVIASCGAGVGGICEGVGALQGE